MHGSPTFIRSTHVGGKSSLISTQGFVEGGGAISIEAAHTARNTSVDGLSWRNLPGIGRTLSGITPWPRGGADANYTAGTGPSVYVIYHSQHLVPNPVNIPTPHAVNMTFTISNPPI